MVNVLAERQAKKLVSTLDILGGARALPGLSKTEIIEALRANWFSCLVRGESKLVSLPNSLTLLGTSRKIEKSMEVFEDLFSVVTYLAPYKSGFIEGSKKNNCPWASNGDTSKGKANCVKPCLGTNSGRMGMEDSVNARIWKTCLWHSEKAIWRELYSRELRALEKKAAKHSGKAMVRFDGTSDLGEGLRLARLPEWQNILWVDYTKSVRRALAPHPQNYTVCYSYSGVNGENCRKVLEAGRLVSVVFDRNPRKHEPLPKTCKLGGKVFSVQDGNRHDALCYHAPGVVVGLSFKAAKDRLGSLEAAGPFVYREGISG